MSKEYIIVPKEDYVDTCDAIREKTNSTALLKSNEMAQAVRDISASAKEEQEKTIDITENGTYDVLADENKALSKVTVNVDVKDEEFIGVKYSDFGVKGYMLPKIADARSLSKTRIGDFGSSNRGFITSHLFYNGTKNQNSSINSRLEKVYLPDGLTVLAATFYNCSALVEIIGDLSTVKELNSTFCNCVALPEIPYLPNLEKLGGNSFLNCVSLKSITFHKVLTTWHSNAFQGCTNITEVNLADGWNISSYVQHCPNLTQASLHNMIEKYADMTGQTSPVMNVGSVNLEKIDDEHKAMATAKNITLA